ncbi:hypothetical protein [Arthrobacter antibioticus]|uniref:hypothetical protein n=1 Tax=Arthrobacter sp. H35-MC1 TaxID=3046203 RepID=UPI0024BBE133|nr:hypothetical protein [Arthrobacter sp. H35-MC1]MDJ0317964.1 hypothetical protein [Arthrobacter sp. H35-MC1]
MSLEDDVHQRVLDMDGVAVVYAVDPTWRTAVKTLGGLLLPAETAAATTFVACSETADPGSEGMRPVLTAPVLTVKVRVGTDGSVPAPQLARSVATGIRTFVAPRRPDFEVRVLVQIAAIGV